jgi:hypothetical protein
MANIKGSVRTSQLITTYGVGSVIAVEDESWTVAGLHLWNVGEPDIREPRLEKELRVNGFVRPPATGDDEQDDVPVFRFPGWCYCPTCNRLDRHGQFCAPNDNHCERCEENPALIPSRFVVACPRGHLDDFPYSRWVHGGRDLRGVDHKLRFTTLGVSAALRDVEIRCSCGASETMAQAFVGATLARIAGGCTGRRPWLDDTEVCDEEPRGIQRGASNGWYPLLHSSISIPPWSETAFRRISRHWAWIKNISDSDLPAVIGAQPGLITEEFSLDDLVEVVRQRKRLEAGEDTGDERLRDQEYEALQRGREERTYQQDFVCVPSRVAVEVSDWFAQVMLVKRLREVRALASFTRLLPPDQQTDSEYLAELALEEVHWLPAIEVSGEGVFIKLNPERLAAWEGNASVQARVDGLNARYAASQARSGAVVLRPITARFVAIHTLAHVLIDQWALDSGYGASELRERLYVSDEMTGLLIYTATSDSSGSLGGLVARGEPGSFAQSLRDAITRTAWCSADPLCIESTQSGVDGLNVAACHACVLLPETSCEERNCFLDRALLVGTPENPDLGLFLELVG